MFDAQGVRHLAETIEAVRATAREQVEYNSETVRECNTADIRCVLTCLLSAPYRLLQKPCSGDVAAVPGDQGESRGEEPSRSVRTCLVFT